MGKFFLLTTGFVITALATSLTARAQKFQQPTPDELRMTSDPKAPGAPAVYLYREETTDNRFHNVSSYARIKVLTELGKEFATVEVPYVPGFSEVPAIEGRTIHPDGTVIPLTGKAEDLLIFKNRGNHVKGAVFNLPSVEVGSILEYRWTIPITGGHVSGTLDDEEQVLSGMLAGTTPEWEVQQPIFVHKEHFYFNPYSSLEADSVGEQAVTYFVDGERANFLLCMPRLPAGAQVEKGTKGDYTLDIRDVPAIPIEANSPPVASLKYRVQFYRTPYPTPQVYWENETARWTKQLDLFASQSQAIKDAASQIDAGAATPEAKARKLYDAVQALENTDFTRAKTEGERKQLHMKRELKKAQDVWNEKSGSSNDIAALYLALARADGLNADGLEVVDRDQRIFDPNYLSLHQFDSLLVVLHIEGKDIYLDPGEKLCPFGQLAWTHVMAGGIEENAKEAVYTPPNSMKDTITAHTADLTIDAHGGVTGTVKLLMNGLAALEWRQKALRSDPDEVNKQLNESLRGVLPGGVTGEVAAIQGLDTSAGFLTVTVKVQGHLGSITGKRLLLPAFFFSSGEHREFVAEQKREEAVDMHYAEQNIDDAVYHLPAGYTVESAPQPVQLPWPEHAALVVKTQAGPGTIDIKHIFARAFVLLPATEYGALRGYYQKVAANDQQQVVLTAGGAAVQ